MQMGWVPVGYVNGSQPGGRAQVGGREADLFVAARPIGARQVTQSDNI
jgi:hypothetical protein